MGEEEDKNEKDLSGAIEAVLFAYGEPMRIEKLAKVLAKDFGKMDIEEIKSAAEKLRLKLKKEGGGLALLSSGTGQNEEIQLATKPEFSNLLEKFVKEEFREALSPASLETLGLILYLSPISRAQIDSFRGVNSSFILRNLMIRGLITRNVDPKRSHIYLYEPSFDLLKYLGVSRKEEMPEYEKFRALAEKGSDSINA